MGTFFSFCVPKRSPFSLFQAEEGTLSRSIHYLLNVDHLNPFDIKISLNESQINIQILAHVKLINILVFLMQVPTMLRVLKTLQVLTTLQVFTTL